MIHGSPSLSVTNDMIHGSPSLSVTNDMIHGSPSLSVTNDMIHGSPSLRWQEKERKDIIMISQSNLTQQKCIVHRALFYVSR